MLLAPLARGGMGELHLAVSGPSELRKLVVIKQIISHLASDDYARRFADEAALMIKLSHGNIVPVFESGIFEGQYFLVMEFIDGTNLRRVFNALRRARRACPVDVAVHIVKEICRGLHYAHTFGDLGLVHRDVSPPNVLLSHSGEVKLTDFGLAFSTIKLKKTAPGVLFGKLGYMAPEQARNEPVDPRSDIYAAGVILWELATGRRLAPRKDNQLARVMWAANPQIDPPSSVRPGLPPALDAVVMRALAPQRTGRYPDAEAMRKALAGLLARLDPTTDATAVQHLLSELFGEKIAEERRKRDDLLRRLEPAITALQRGQAVSPMAVAPLEEEEGPAGSAPYGLPVLAPSTMLGGRYRIEAVLQEGGMGMVYRATHVEIERSVAIKVLHPAYSRMPEVVSRFRREAKAASRIGHPNIVEVLDFGATDEGSVFLVMEHLEGQDLADVLADVQRLEIDRAVRITIQICQALAAAHGVSIVHRDLKPENIFLVPREGDVDFVKVLDFGIAQVAQADESRAEPFTNPGVPLGTPEYMAPEQAAGASCDHRADIYSTGAMLYEMLTGRTPHRGDNPIEVLSRKASHEIVAPGELRAEIPPAVERVVLWALEFDPAQRPQSMGELAYELTKLSTGRPMAVASMLGITGKFQPPPAAMSASITGPEPAIDAPLATRSTARRWLGVTAALGAGALVVALVVGFWSSRRSTAPARVSAQPAANPGAVARRPARARKIPTVPRVKASAPQPARDGPRLLRIGKEHLQGGRFPQARRAFEKARRSPRTRARALRGLAELAFQRGDFAAARRYAERSIAAGGGLRAELVLGNALFKLGQYARAIEIYRRVLARDAGHAEARRNIDAARRLLAE